jgi:hypothetical protein
MSKQPDGLEHRRRTLSGALRNATVKGWAELLAEANSGNAAVGEAHGRGAGRKKPLKGKGKK